MKVILMTVRLWWFYLTYKGIKKAEIRKIFAKNFKGKIYECVSKTNWEKDLMKIPKEEREFFKQFVGKVGLCFECDKVEEITTRQDRFKEFMFYETSLDMEDLCKQSCLEYNELDDYLYGENGYAIHITKLEIFDKPKELSEFKYCLLGHNNCVPHNCSECPATKPLTRAPQSWQFIEV